MKLFATAPSLLETRHSTDSLHLELLSQQQTERLDSF